MKLFNNIKSNLTKRNIALLIIFMAGFFVRLFAVGKYPLGLNQDEASAGYDAFSILYYGIDRNGMSYPVHLIAWGSGQNALYSYLCMPFILVFGLTEFSIRLPMALMGCVSLVLIYFISKRLLQYKYAIIVTAFFAISPWHIMKSRWALESNLFPELILLCVFLLIKYQEKYKKRYIVSAAFVLGLSAYAYGTAYLFIPVFAIPVLLYLLVNKRIKPLDAFFAAAVAILTALPVILFVIINTFDLDGMKYLCFTIPKLYVSRHMEVTSIFSHEFLSASWENFKNTINILIEQEDGLIWNAESYYGINYVCSLPFTLVGLYISFRSRCFGNVFRENHIPIINIWFISSVVVALVVNPNINRLNILMIPFIIYSGIGTAYAADKLANVRKIIFVMYTCLFVSFCFKYFGEFQEKIKYSFFYSLSDAIEFAGGLEKDTIYVTDQINMPYIFTLFYDGENPNEYINTAIFSNRYSAFERVNSYGKYIFGIPEYYYVDENAAIIVDNSHLNEYDLNYYNIEQFDLYSVLYN